MKIIKRPGVAVCNQADVTTQKYLSVPLQVLPHSDSLLDQVVQILRQVRGQTLGLQDPQDLVACDKAHLSHTMGIPQDHTCMDNQDQNMNVQPYTNNTKILTIALGIYQLLTTL